MSDLWLVSYIVLWVLVLFEAAMIFVLMRELGGRILGTAEGVMRDGLELGSVAPAVKIVDGNGRTHVVQPTGGRWLLLVFASRYCAPCQALIPDLNQFAARRRDELDVAVVFNESPASVGETIAELGVTVTSGANHDAMREFKARVTPFAFVLDETGHVRAKSMVNGTRSLGALLDFAHAHGGRTGADATLRHGERKEVTS